MPGFASRSPRRDAARRASPPLIGLRLWAFPAVLLAGWLVAAAFSLSSLGSASVAWKAKPAVRPALVEEIEVTAPAPTQRISRARPASLLVPGCPKSAPPRRAAKEALHPG